MATINVLIAVDAAKLAMQIKDGTIKPGFERNPCFLHSYANSDVYITIISQSSSVNNNSKESELQIKCRPTDKIEWAITSFTNNADHSVFIYNVKSILSSVKPSYCSSSIDNYLPAPGGGTTIGNVTKYVNQVLTVQTRVLKKCSILFQLIDNSTAQVIGYFAYKVNLTTFL